MPSGNDQNRIEYERRLHRVLEYIDAHLEEDLTLGVLANVANFSAFHFHRIFSAHVGETLGNYLTRRRVEKAASYLSSQPALGVLPIALSVGFGSSESFSRAFKLHLGCTPTTWRNRSCEQPGAKSKIGQLNRNPDQAVPRANLYGGSMNHSKTSPLHVVVAKRPTVRIAYLRYQGPFGAKLGLFWQNEVCPWLAANDLLGRARYGISRNDPEIMESSKCCYDAGAEIDAHYVPSRKAQVCEIPGGLYASTTFKGFSPEVPALWDRLLREWFPESGYQLDARPCFEYYAVNGFFDEQTGAFSCELMAPVTKL